MLYDLVDSDPSSHIRRTTHRVLIDFLDVIAFKKNGLSTIVLLSVLQYRMAEVNTFRRCHHDPFGSVSVLFALRSNFAL